MDGMEPPGTDGMATTTGTAGMVGTMEHGLSLKPSYQAHHGGMTHGEDGTLPGKAGTLNGAGIPHGDQDLTTGDGETGTEPGMEPGTQQDQSSLELEQELLFLKHK